MYGGLLSVSALFSAVVFHENAELFSLFGAWALAFFFFSIMYLGCVFAKKSFVEFFRMISILFVTLIGLIFSNVIQKFHQSIVGFLGL